VTHLSAAEIEALVLGDVPPPGDARLRHLATCPECARRLAHEARVELALLDAVAASAEGAPRTAPVAGTSRRVFAVAAMLALVLAGSLYIASVRTRPVPPTRVDPPQPPAADTPCLVDPISLGAGQDASVPSAPGLHVTAPETPEIPDGALVVPERTAPTVMP